MRKFSVFQTFHLQYVHEDLLQKASEESLVVHAAGATRVEVYNALSVQMRKKQELMPRRQEPGSVRTVVAPGELAQWVETMSLSRPHPSIQATIFCH